MSAIVQLESTLTCPACGRASVERMPTDACLHIWTCSACGARVRPKQGDCCVFCSYGSVPCPSIQATRSASGLAEHMLAAFPALDAFEQRLSLALYRELARGEPVTAPLLASRVDADGGEVARRLESWPAVRYDERRRIVGYWGLTIIPTRHRLRIGELDLYAWCAWDTLFLPALLGTRAEVHSACRASGAPVRLTVGPDSLDSASPENLALSFVLPAAQALRADVVASFCRNVHFFASAELAAGCGELPPSSFVLGLDAAFEAGRLRNRRRYRSVAG